MTNPNSTSATTPTTDSYTYIGAPDGHRCHHHGQPGGRPDRRRHPGDHRRYRLQQRVGRGLRLTPATCFLVNSSTRSPPSLRPASGTVDITVTTGVGTSATSSADLYAYNGTLGVVNGNAVVLQLAGHQVPVTATSQTGTTVTVSAPSATGPTGTQVVLSGFTNGLTAGTYTS